MPLNIKATGATLRALKLASLGEFDETKALELAVGKKFGGMIFGRKSTIPNEEYTQALVDYGRSARSVAGTTKTLEVWERIKELEKLAENADLELKSEKQAINPVNFLAAITCLGKDEEKAALRILRLYFALKRAAYRMLDRDAAGYFGGSVRQDICGGFAKVGMEKFWGWGGMAGAAHKAIENVNKRLGYK